MVVTRVVPTNARDSSSSNGDFYADLDKAKRRPGCFSCGGCLGLIGILLFAVVIGVAGLVAASGIVRVPLLSAMLYKEDPQPRRVVEPATATSFATLFAQVGTGGALTLTEAQLTAALREPTSAGQVPLKRGQLAIDRNSVELYGQVTTGEFGEPVIVRVEGTMVNDTVIEATSVKVGYVDVPLQLAKFLAPLIAGQDISRYDLARHSVTSLILGPGSIDIVIDAQAAAKNALTGLLTDKATEILQSSGIDPDQLENLTTDELTKLQEQLKNLSAAEQSSLKASFPQLNLID